MNYNNIAKQIIQCVGGKENITGAMHCATRLRLNLIDENKVNEEALTDIDVVKGTFLAKGQYQIILGPGLVNLVCDEVTSILGIKNESVHQPQKEEEKGNLLQRAVQLLSDIFVPIIPAIVAGGLLMGINNILTANGLFFKGMSLIEAYPQWADLATMINLFSNAAFTFLPVLIGFSATKKFGGNPYLGAALGMIMVHPELLNAYSYGKAGVDVPVWNIFGLSIEAVGYQGTVLPVLGVSWILANIEKRLHKITPIWLDNLTTPLFSTIITGFITFIIVGPVLREAGILLSDGISWMYNSLGLFGGAIFGLFYAPICLTGMHHSFIAVETQLLAAVATTGGSFIFPTASMSNVAQGAAVIAILLLTKDKKLKSICSASGVSALLGITEPAMFGVTLKLKYPFIAAMIGSAVGSAYLAATKTLAIALGAAGLPGFISIESSSWLNFAIGMILSAAVSFVITMILYKRDVNKQVISVKEQESIKTEIINAPLTGRVAPINEAPDEIFAQKMMGDGIVIFPTENILVAPVSGKITMIFPSKHAIGIKTSDDVEILIHIGLDTVKLEGKPFTLLVNEGQEVKQGDKLMEIDFEMIEKAGYSSATPVIITSQNRFEIISMGNNKINQEIIKLI
ncbi:sucrose-specific PTS transporter subunit IIBC [Thomasclavelia cocleata]|uniref:sucrose-specific PTS transporter subunit IIBC n=1 Tax=Thomasclavelia cocleata TaxID=69824 RepID=UPI00241ECB1B|nr:sucrose-specific PTS transporter subunit IIBC [Thomasclavelia cocleata]